MPLLEECRRPDVGIWKLRLHSGRRDLPVTLANDPFLRPAVSVAEKERPLRMVLRMDPKAGKFQVYVGQILFRFDDKAIAKAKVKLSWVMEKYPNADTANIDCGPNVPMHWVMEVLDMLVKAELATIYFVGLTETIEKGD
jgi:hypothetical protein